MIRDVKAPMTIKFTLKTLVLILAWIAGVGMGHAQLYAVDREGGVIREYDTSTGALINQSLISNLHRPSGIALAGDFLYITEYDIGRVGNTRRGLVRRGEKRER